MNTGYQLKEFGLTDLEINKLISVFEKHPAVETAIIYGSRAKGNYLPYSDIDIALTGTDLDFTTQQVIEIDLDDLLLPYKIDLSVLHKLKNQDLLDHIERVGKIFYPKI